MKTDSYDDGYPKAKFVEQFNSKTIRSERIFTKEDKDKIMNLANEYAYWSEVYAYNNPHSDSAKRAGHARNRAKSELEAYLDSL